MTVKDFGACAKLVVLDASRRNPYERRFRAFSHGLAPVTVPDNALILTSASPGAVTDDSTGENSRAGHRTAQPYQRRPKPEQGAGGGSDLQPDPRRDLTCHRRRTGALGLFIA